MKPSEPQHVGQIAQAASKYLDCMTADASRAKLSRILQLAQAAETSPTRCAAETAAVQNALCAFCKSENIFVCRGFQRQNGCAFVETGLALTPSQFASIISHA